MTSSEYEPHRVSHLAKLNWLRAGVLGANDGIVSIAALVVGVAAARRLRAVPAPAAADALPPCLRHP